MSQGDVFNRLPPEVIQHLAIVACGLTFLGPPSELAALMPVNRAIYSALCVQRNPVLHAHIFSVKFDSSAPTRRFSDAGEPLTVRSFAYELRRRWICLRRIRKVSNAGKLLVCSEADEREDLWLIYLMFIESDGRNCEQLAWAKINGYLRVILREKLATSSKPGYLVESTTRALGLWLMWFSTEIYTVAEETSSEIFSMFALLRPWALASHKYDILCAPYTHWQLPARDEPDLGEEPIAGIPGLGNFAYLDLRNRTEMVMHMRHHIQLAPPRASMAAIMAFIVRLERNGPIPAQPAPVIPNLPAQMQQLGHPGLTIYPRTRYPAFYGRGSIEFDGRVNRTGSAAYDIEWRRILQCGNPFADLKFKAMPMFRSGDLAGHWEGRSVFLTFDAFRNMVTGVLGVATSDPIAQQPHNWRIREHHLLHRRRLTPLGRESEEVTGEKVPVGAALDAYIPQEAQFIQHGGVRLRSAFELIDSLNIYIQPSDFSTRHLEVRIPDSAAPSGYRSYNYTTLDGPTDSPPTQIQMNSVVPEPASMEVDMSVSPDWEQLQSPSLGGNEFEEKILDTLITGEGCSGWGSFKLRGRVRAWDGLIILVKEYDRPTIYNSTRWLYKGYLVSGGNWVGRWRDTFTSVHLSGYEGVFSITRRY
ncbi:hypothetical protein FRC11_004281 [Ceratobasidium sp. 423]|nr:hypothetical protein FRC11_004281 [Ceratobasidium sp. 423]